jgi:hypothetical protein
VPESNAIELVGYFLLQAMLGLAQYLPGVLAHVPGVLFVVALGAAAWGLGWGAASRMALLEYAH